MFLNSSENEKLFAKLVPVSMKDVYTNQSRTSHLFLSMEWQEAKSGGYNRKVLSITLTDDDNPHFLYYLNLCEEDFQMLKESQSIVISFSSFPQHIIDFIEDCLREEKNPQPKFLLNFTFNEKLGNVAASSQLNIIQISQFKHITQLFLKFVAATDLEVRQYIASRFRCLKEEKRQLKNNLAFMEQDLKDKLAACQHSLAGKVAELELVKKELNVELTMKDNKHQVELQEQRDKLINKHKDELERLVAESNTKEENFRREIQRLETRVKALDSLNQDLQDKNYKHESTIKDLKSKVISREDEIKHLRENLQSYKEKSDELQSEIKELKTHIRQEGKKMNEIQQNLHEKEEDCHKLKSQIEFEIESKKKIENDLERIRFRLDMGEKTREMLENNQAKLNDIIVSLQEKAKELMKEDKAKSQVIAKYKKTVEEKDQALQTTKQEIADLNIHLKSRDAEISSLESSIHPLHRKLDELEKNLRDKENTLKEQISVIKWLNRQLTDNCIVPQYVPPSHLATSPSCLAQKQLAKLNSPSPENSPSTIIGKNVTTKSVSLSMSGILEKELKNGLNISCMQAKYLYSITAPQKKWY